MIDENMTGSLAFLLVEAGYEVLQSIEIVGVSAADNLVAQAALQNDCILITGDRDFKRAEKWKSEKHQQSFADLSMILVNMEDSNLWNAAVLRYLPLMICEQSNQVKGGGSPWFFCQIRDRWVNFMRR
jgi:predicted nuclease of predicted toxin-antitoxin system